MHLLILLTEGVLMHLEVVTKTECEIPVISKVFFYLKQFLELPVKCLNSKLVLLKQYCAETAPQFI